MGVRVNTTASMPVGFYRTVDRAPAVGDIVYVCPPDTEPFKLARARGYIDSGSCPGGYGRVIKRILAAKMDWVSIDADGVSVNGRRLSNSAQISSDTSARPLPALRMQPTPLANDDVLLMATENPRSFDARYFGPVSAAQIEATLTPLWTW